MGLDHSSNTAYRGDNYTEEHVSWRLPDGWTKLYKGHACYDPQKVWMDVWEGVGG